jgi:toxin CcdB
MAQFDVFQNISPKSKTRAPYLVEVQGNYCDATSTCVVIPLFTIGTFIPASVLNPTIWIDENEYILCTAEITSVLRSNLGRRVGSIKHYHDEIIQAIDRLLQ